MSNRVSVGSILTWPYTSFSVENREVKFDVSNDTANTSFEAVEEIRNNKKNIADTYEELDHSSYVIFYVPEEVSEDV